MAEIKRRRSFEPGHRLKFLVLVDGTPECDRALHFAVRRAARLNARVVMLAVAEPPESFEWLGVGDAMREEAEAEIRERLDALAAGARHAAGVDPECLVRTGERADEILRLIREDEDIGFLVLAAATGTDGPGPLVASIAGRAAGSFPVPVVIVPGALTEAEITALAG
ncbi:UspA domain protein [Methylobacterium sp. 4-46]|uniref:universal stress protein n=1 Tax=unclassified Methylobacterium TaxID=2615210 RepID=UPI000165C7AA|nr:MULTISPECIES: universal stress protein [Methylobacterium]ACA17785.1 UspA domain protein [Methylobacterium sp. 4-46]WFT83453.1 universal stress protein [Methylobacterium nodulans]